MHLIALHDGAGSILGPKFLYFKSIFSLKEKLAFILPNFKPGSRIGPHNHDVISVLVGSLLGDGHAERLRSGGVRFRFRQPVKHREYIFWLHEFFNKRGYCTNNLPVLFEQKYGDKIYQAYRFGTYGFASLKWLYNLFYTHSKIKIVPKNIADLLTPLALAVWAMSAGKFIHGKVKLYTEFCKGKDIEKLINALNDSFGLVCSMDKCKKNLYIVIIPKEYVKIFQAIVLPYVIPTLKYKIGLGTPSNYYYNKACYSFGNRFYSTMNKSSCCSYSSSSSDNSSSVPVASYINPILLKSVIYKENQKKVGVYRWTNLISGKTYIGSSTNLAKRFSYYFSNKFLTREIKRIKNMVYSALLKYGYSNFKLEVLEYCDSEVLLSKEQEYLDIYCPEYNILKKLEVL